MDTWFEELDLDLPNPGALAGDLADPDLRFDDFMERLDLLKQINRELAELPEVASEYLKAVADRPNTQKLMLLYWASVHYPLRDLYSELSAALSTFLTSSWLDRLMQNQRIRQNSEASQKAVEVFCYESSDFYGSGFSWSLQIYRTRDQIFAEAHQWTEDGDGMEPSVREISSGQNLADMLSIGESDEIWNLAPNDYLSAVERVFDFDAQLGIDFLSALHFEYEIDVGEISRADLGAAWETLLAELDKDTNDDSTKEVDYRRHEQHLRPATEETPATASTGHCRRENSGENSDFEDPIRKSLGQMRVEPTDVSELRKRRGVGPWAQKIAAERNMKRREAARLYLIDFIQKNLDLPRGRHTVRGGGQSAGGFWADFG